MAYRSQSHYLIIYWVGLTLSSSKNYYFFSCTMYSIFKVRDKSKIRKHRVRILILITNFGLYPTVKIYLIQISTVNSYNTIEWKLLLWLMICGNVRQGQTKSCTEDVLGASCISSPRGGLYDSSGLYPLCVPFQTSVTSSWGTELSSLPLWYSQKLPSLVYPAALTTKFSAWLVAILQETFSSHCVGVHSPTTTHPPSGLCLWRSLPREISPPSVNHID